MERRGAVARDAEPFPASCSRYARGAARRSVGDFLGSPPSSRCVGLWPQREAPDRDCHHETDRRPALIPAVSVPAIPILVLVVAICLAMPGILDVVPRVLVALNRVGQAPLLREPVSDHEIELGHA
jgi:hypothetical protein